MLQARRLTICLFCFVDTNFHGSFLQAMEFYQPLVHFVGEYDTSLDGLSYQNKKNVLHRKNLFFLFLAYLKIILQRLAHLFGNMTGSKKGVCPKNFLGDHCLLAPALMFLLCSLGGQAMLLFPSATILFWRVERDSVDNSRTSSSCDSSSCTQVTNRQQWCVFSQCIRIFICTCAKVYMCLANMCVTHSSCVFICISLCICDKSICTLSIHTQEHSVLFQT